MLNKYRNKRKAAAASTTTKKRSILSRSKARVLSPEEIHGLIKAKAYEIFLKRGNRSGDQVSDWLNAERQVKKELRINQ